MEIKYKINSRILLLALLGLIMTCTSYLMFMYDPLQLIIKRVATLRPGSIFLKLWSDPPYEVFIDVYIFNVTNAEEFLRGEKLQVEEVGPYVYQELLTNNNATFHDNGTMTFYPRRDLRFRPELSIGNPDEDHIISPNIPLLGITASLRDSMFQNMAVASFASIIGSKGILNLTVAEYLWGYDDPLVNYANTLIPSWINFKRFGILDRLMALDNASNVVTLNTHPELMPSSPLLSKSEQDAVYHIHTFNGSPGLKQWGYQDGPRNQTLPSSNTRCNLVEGSYEGTVFPPNFKSDATFKMYRRAFCRPVPFHQDGRVVTRDGFDGVKFQVDELFLARPEENPENACYCLHGRCPRKGLGNLSPCYYDIPIDISQPHFYNSDPWLLAQIGGMRPNKTLHDSSFVLQPQLGVPLEASLRIQINLDVGETRYSSATRPFNGLVLPLFWLQMRIAEIPGSVRLLISACFHVLPVVQQVLVYLLGLGGLALISSSALFALFFTREERNGRLSFRSSYSPIPIIPMHSPYFKPELRILKG